MIPNKQQYKKWSLPSKLTFISFILAIVLFIIPILWNFLFAPTWMFFLEKYHAYNEKKYYREYAQALLYYGNREYEKAAEYFNFLVDACPKPDQGDLVVWRLDCDVRQKRYDKAQEDFTNYVKNNPQVQDDDQLRLLALGKVDIMISERQFKDLYDYLKDMPNDSGLVQQAKIVSAWVAGDLQSFREMLVETKMPLFLNQFDRIFQYGLWIRCFNERRPAYDDQLIALISLAYARKCFPEEFDQDFLMTYAPLFNLRMYSLTDKEALQLACDSIISDIRYNSSVLYKVYEKDIIEYGIDIGSTIALKKRLDDLKIANSSNIVAEINSKLNDDVTLSFKIKKSALQSDILWLVGRGDEKINNVKLLFSTIMKRISIDNLSGKFNITNEIDFDAMPLSWVDLVDSQDSASVFIVSTIGSGLFKIIAKYTITDKKYTVISPIEDEKDYHSNHFYSIEQNGYTVFNWRYEINNDCDANSTSKVFGEISYRAKDDSLVLLKSNLPNPAVEFFEKLDKRSLKYSHMILNQILIENRKVTDVAFINLINNENPPCYIRTTIDQTYETLPEKLHPQMSGLLLQFGNTNFAFPDVLDTNNLFRQMDSLRNIVVVEGEYFVLVKRENGIPRMLDIFRVEDQMIKNSIFEE